MFSFYEKISRAQKHSEANINQQNENKRTKNNKGNGYLCTQKLLREWKSFALRLVFFCARGIFL